VNRSGSSALLAAAAAAALVVADELELEAASLVVLRNI